MENIMQAQTTVAQAQTAVAQTAVAHSSINKNKRTLDNHKWFVERIDLAGERANRQRLKKETDRKITRNKDKMNIVCLIILFIIISYLITFDQYAFLIRMTVMLLYAYSLDMNENQLIPFASLPPLQEDDIILYMRFTRPNIFYKNTHYIYSGPKSRLEKVFGRLKTKVEIYKIDNIKSRDEHDKLMDTPLDTFCNSQCGCDDNDILEYNFENYKCSHWNLYSYDKYEELLEDINEIQKIEKDDNYRGLRNEFIYL